MPTESNSKSTPPIYSCMFGTSQTQQHLKSLGLHPYYEKQNDVSPLLCVVCSHCKQHIHWWQCLNEHNGMYTLLQFMISSILQLSTLSLTSIYWPILCHSSSLTLVWLHSSPSCMLQRSHHSFLFLCLSFHSLFLSLIPQFPIQSIQFLCWPSKVCYIPMSHNSIPALTETIRNLNPSSNTKPSHADKLSQSIPPGTLFSSLLHYLSCSLSQCGLRQVLPWTSPVQPAHFEEHQVCLVFKSLVQSSFLTPKWGN